MTPSESITTALVLSLTATDWETVVDELHAFYAHFSPLFRRPEQRAWSHDDVRDRRRREIPRPSIAPMVLHLHGTDRNAVRTRQQLLRDSALDNAPILHLVARSGDCLGRA